MTQSLNGKDRYAIIAGNGTFPFLVLDAARAEGVEPLVVAIQEEASPDLSSKGADTRWISLGEVSKFFDLLKAERVNKVVLAGQVKHAQLFSNIKPDGLLNRALAGLTRKNTDALIGAFVHMLSRQGIEVVGSTKFLKTFLAGEGPLTTRRPDMAWRLWSPAFRGRLAMRLAEAPFDVVQIEAIELAPYLLTVSRARRESAESSPLIVRIYLKSRPTASGTELAKLLAHGSSPRCTPPPPGLLPFLFHAPDLVSGGAASPCAITPGA